MLFKNLRDFWISVFQYTEIQKPLCTETRRFCKAKLFIFSNLRVSIHGDSKISVYCNTEIQKLLCLIHADFFVKRPITHATVPLMRFSKKPGLYILKFRLWVRPQAGALGIVSTFFALVYYEISAKGSKFLQITP